jgi:predicted pyridoxine 5'-phosphate oxidase superfamily flavin-nucleotide-binding protein
VTIELATHARTFLKELHFAALAKITVDGTPQLSESWYDLDGDEVFMNTVTGWLTERNIHRDPRVSMESR